MNIIIDSSIVRGNFAGGGPLQQRQRSVQKTTAQQRALRIVFWWHSTFIHTFFFLFFVLSRFILTHTHTLQLHSTFACTDINRHNEYKDKQKKIVSSISIFR